MVSGTHNGEVGTRSSRAMRCVAVRVARGAGRRLAVALLPCLITLLAAPAAHAASPSDPLPPPVTTLRVYRALDSRLLDSANGELGKRLGNTNAGSAGGVLGYLHSEVVPAFAGGDFERRFNGIDAIAVFEVRILNVRRARLVARADLAGGMNVFGPFVAFNRGVATPPQARNQLLDYGAYVGVQDQDTNPRHGYGGDWYSFVGACPLSPLVKGPDGQRHKPAPCSTTPALDDICPADGAGPDATLQCQYTYRYLGYVPLDDLVGITSTSQPQCRAGTGLRACADYADFRRNGGVEYAAGPGEGMTCSGDLVPEAGLPFWRGRCDPSRNTARIQALAKWTPLVH